MSQQPATTTRLIDGFGRQIDYIRLSVTDRCDFRCDYCMAEDMTFLPRQQVLSLEELALVGRAFVELGVQRIRITGGEPLIRANLTDLLGELSALPGLRELNLTTNGSRLQQFAPQLRQAGVNRLNISLDSLQPARFRNFTRTGSLRTVLAGIAAARQAGFERIKLNTVVMRGRNDDEVVQLLHFCRDQQLDIAFIEEMPLGDVGRQRSASYCSSETVLAQLAAHFTLLPSSELSAGPARYYRMPDSDIRVGFISPHSHNFCANCNRVRVSVEGRLLLCLGNEHSVDLRAILRRFPGEIEPVQQAIMAAMAHKPERHYFDQSDAPQIVRFMNMTGG